MTNAERVAYIRSRRERGDTLTAIGSDLGISSERVRQIAGRYGIHLGTFWNPDRVLDVCRWAPTKTDAMNLIGTGEWLDAQAMIAASGRLAAVRRRWDMRRRLIMREAAHAYSREQLIDLLQREAARIGCTPSQHDMNAEGSLTAAHTVYHRVFGSLTAAAIAAGLRPNRVGGPGHRNARAPLVGSEEYGCIPKSA